MIVGLTSDRLKFNAGPILIYHFELLYLHKILQKYVKATKMTRTVFTHKVVLKSNYTTHKGRHFRVNLFKFVALCS